MALESLANLLQGGAGLTDRVKNIFTELHGLSVDVVTGAAAATPIALTGIATTDTILVALLVKDPGATTTAAVVKLTPSIPSAGNVQFAEATNAASGDRVVVLWYNKA